MNTKLLIIFSLLTVINVILQTVKSLCTIRCGRSISSLVNAVAYGIYTYVIFFTTSEGVPLYLKAIITAIANFGGVWIANAIFDSLFTKVVRWKVEASIPNLEGKSKDFMDALKALHLEYYQENVSDEYYNHFSIFCATKEESRMLRRVMPVGSKYNIIECIRKL